jgi:hypothetical protein
MEDGLDDQKTRITPDLQGIWRTTQTELDALAMDSQVLDLFRLPHHNFQTSSLQFTQPRAPCFQTLAGLPTTSKIC